MRARVWLCVPVYARAYVCTRVRRMCAYIMCAYDVCIYSACDRAYVRATVHTCVRTRCFFAFIEGHEVFPQKACSLSNFIDHVVNIAIRTAAWNYLITNDFTDINRIHLCQIWSGVAKSYEHVEVAGLTTTDGQYFLSGQSASLNMLARRGAACHALWGSEMAG